MGIDKPTVLITGCSSGFGLYTAIEMAKNGFNVYATMRNLEKKGKLEKISQQENLSINILPLDITDDSSIKKTLKIILDKTHTIDILINNAGICLVGFTEEMPLDDYRKIFETNFFGLVALTQAVLPIMRKAKSGKIINITSTSDILPEPALSAYCASKAAVRAFSESLNVETYGDGYYIVNVCPGTYKTEIFSSTLENSNTINDLNSPHLKKIIHLKSKWEKLLKHANNPIEIAKTIVVIAKEKKPKINYYVGTDAKIEIILKHLLPNHWIDWLFKKFWWKGFKHQ